MLVSVALIAALATSVYGAAVQPRLALENRLYTIEVGPGDIRTVTFEEKWALFRDHVHFFDITEFQDDPVMVLSERQSVVFPTAVAQGTSVRALLPKLSKTNMQSTLTTFSNFNNRYSESRTGAEASAWLLQQVQSLIRSSGAANASASAFTQRHTWGQPSVVAVIPGRSTKTIVVGAHLDSVNGNNPVNGRAPGADDNGSGSMTNLEAFRVLLSDSRIASGQAPNTIEFHWYAAEEDGLLGSQAIFSSYRSAGRNIKAMLNQDMTGFVKAGTTPVFGLVTDFTDTGLTEFIRKVITAYCGIGYANTRCNYACSDHASANRNGYPAAIAFEGTFANSNPSIHSASDTIDKVNFDKMLEHAKLVVGYAYELAFASSL